MRWFSCLTFAAVVALTWMTWQQSQATAELAAAISLLEHRQMDPYITTWRDAEGLTHTVTTHPAEGETPDETAERHEARVNALKALFPPVE